MLKKLHTRFAEMIHSHGSGEADAPGVRSRAGGSEGGTSALLSPSEGGVGEDYARRIIQGTAVSSYACAHAAHLKPIKYRDIVFRSYGDLTNERPQQSSLFLTRIICIVFVG